MIAVSHSTLGLGMVIISGAITATFPVPMKYSRAWKWENTWFVYATFSLIMIPLALASWAVPHLSSVYASIEKVWSELYRIPLHRKMQRHDRLGHSLRPRSPALIPGGR
jgi:hypothetical protein